MKKIELSFRSQWHVHQRGRISVFFLFFRFDRWTNAVTDKTAMRYVHLSVSCSGELLEGFAEADPAIRKTLTVIPVSVLSS